MAFAAAPASGSPNSLIAVSVIAFSVDASDDALAAVYAAAAGVVLLLIVLLFSYAARPWAAARDTDILTASSSGS